MQRLPAFLRLQRLSLRHRLRRLRKNGSGIVLMAVLALSIGEPLMCVIHCDLWLPLFYKASSIHMHQHVHTPGMLMPASGTAHQQLTPIPARGDGCPNWLNSRSGTAVPTPPLPIHEISIGILVMLVFVRGSEQQRRLPILTPPESPPPVHFRPPILRAT